MGKKLEKPRIGPKMAMVAWYVYRHPGCVKYHAAEFSAPGADMGSPGVGYGYASVNRAISAGLVRAESKGSRYALYLTAAGREYVKKRFGVRA